MFSKYHGQFSEIIWQSKINVSLKNSVKDGNDKNGNPHPYACGPNCKNIDFSINTISKFFSKSYKNKNRMIDFVARQTATQYWNYNDATRILTSKNAAWDNRNFNIRSMPREGTTGLIEASDGRVLGLSNGLAVAGNKATFQVRDEGDTGQLWTRGRANTENFFILRNQHANMLLTSSRGTDTSIEKHISYSVMEPQKIKDIRWVNFRYKAGENLFRHWQMLVHHLTEVKNGRRIAPYTKARAAELLDFLLNKEAMMTLALQLDLQVVFKAISLEVQKAHVSFIGTSSKKTYLLEGLNKIQQDQGEFIKKICAEMECQLTGTVVWIRCGNLQNIYIATKVRWHGFILDKVDVLKFHSVSAFKDRYIQTVRQYVEFYLPPSNLLQVFSHMDQRKWNEPIANLRQDRATKAAFVAWPTLFGIPNRNSENDFDALVRFFENNPFWNNRKLGPPTEFWRLLLIHFNQMSPTLREVIESTLCIPYGSDKAEKAFAFLNYEKTPQRSLLDMKTVAALIRISMHPDTIQTFNPEKAIEEYKKSAELCD